MPESLSIGDRIKELATIQNYNLKQLAKKADVPYTTLYAIVNRHSNRINPETLLKIAHALDTTPLQLQGLNYDPFPFLQHDIAEAFIERCKKLAEIYPKEQIELYFGDQEYLDKLIDGRKQPTEQDLSDVADQLDLSEEYLIGLTDDPKDSPSGSSVIPLVAFQIKNILQKNMNVACSTEEAKEIAISLWNYIQPENIIPLFKAINAAKPEYQRAAWAALQAGVGNEEADHLLSINHKAWYIGLAIKPTKSDSEKQLYDIWKNDNEKNPASFTIETDLTLQEAENYVENAIESFHSEFVTQLAKLKIKKPPQTADDPSEAE